MGAGECERCRRNGTGSGELVEVTVQDGERKTIRGGKGPTAEKDSGQQYPGRQSATRHPDGRGQVASKERERACEHDQVRRNARR